jgi:hypothetical protein
MMHLERRPAGAASGCGRTAQRKEITMTRACLPTRSFLAVAAALAAAGVYAKVVRPWYLRWGATGEEIRQALPGDEIIPHATSQETRAITIKAPVEAVWPWLAQMGQGRGGLYSYDALENLFGLDIHSLDRIDPALQQIQPGDLVRFAPNGNLGMRVAAVEPNRLLGLRGIDPKSGGWMPDSDWSWTFVLQPIDGRSCRLLSRGRAIYWRTPTGFLLKAMNTLMEPVVFVMLRRMLLGIKERAEQAVPTAVEAPAWAAQTPQRRSA